MHTPYAHIYACQSGVVLILVLIFLCVVKRVKVQE